MIVRIRPEAEADIAAAYTYYEEASEGLGAEFLRTVEATLAIVERTPQLYAVVHRDVRRALLRRFPYDYMVDGDTIIVLACFHARRDPAQQMFAYSIARIAELCASCEQSRQHFQGAG